MQLDQICQAIAKILFDFMSLARHSLASVCFCQTLGLVLRLRVDFVLPLSQEEEQEEQEE